MGAQRIFAGVLGAILLLVGIVGLFIGTGTLVVFDINHPHNWVHIVSGLVGLLAAIVASGTHAKLFNRTFGIVYGIVAILGFAGVAAVVNILNINMADNILHAAIALGCLAIGFGVKE